MKLTNERIQEAAVAYDRLAFTGEKDQHGRPVRRGVKDADADYALFKTGKAIAEAAEDFKDWDAGRRRQAVRTVTIHAMDEHGNKLFDDKGAPVTKQIEDFESPEARAKYFADRRKKLKEMVEVKVFAMDEAKLKVLREENPEVFPDIYELEFMWEKPAK